MPSNNGYHQFANGPPSHRYSDRSQAVPAISQGGSITRPYSADELVMRGHQPPPLKINDKVVWISDSGPEYGIVKWLGKLPDVGNEWMAGVEFVNPVGSGTGLYNDFRLFETRQNHASLVPIVGLLKASDFVQSSNSSRTEGKGNVEAAGNNEGALPIKPKRNKKVSQESYKFYTDSTDCCDGSPEALTSSERSNEIATLCTNFADLNNTKRRVIANSKSSDNIKHINERSENVETSPRLSRQVVVDLPPIKSTSSLASSKEAHEKVEASSQYSPDNEELYEHGTMVEVFIDRTPYYGVIRWLGFLKNDLDYPIDMIKRNDKNFRNVVVGIELEEEISGLSNGLLNGKKFFTCPPNKAYFTELQNCRQDSRFPSSTGRPSKKIMQPSSEALRAKNDAQAFGAIECPTVLGDVPPLSNSEQLTLLCGKNRGIQGNHNSCYLDATLFAMFTCSTVFESLLHRPKKLAKDIPEYNEVQRILKEEIVNPLRKNYYVRADRVMKLRQILERISSMRGLTTEEKDPEEFLDLLLNEILKTEPYLKLTSGESISYQLFVEKDEKLSIPTVQQLFDQSFLAGDLKLREVPPCLIIQMPRFGRDYKMYPRIIPSAQLDITNVLEASPRQCTVCGELAEWECKECFGQMGEGLDSISFCNKCCDTSHVDHPARIKHKMKRLTIPSEFTLLKEHTNIPRVMMNLFAVLCIETSHYVSFVKCGTEADSPWCFFDSMADRKGEQDGYNIPEVVAVPNLKFWQNESAIELLNTAYKDDKLMPELPRRLLCDAYICFYSSPEVLRYR